ncbi:putative GTP-binding protein OBGC2 [Vitis vinifera]|uniref:Putative GTP-binding protein OBGC2 n=1 Tax=Vitis vinifera TaxID=29760 RepID=A0A438K1K0_VITVI|nr:putative GTP-binding protein OBGC2 [Vitis vinifera]
MLPLVSLQSSNLHFGTDTLISFFFPDRLLPKRFNQQRCSFRSSGQYTLKCRLTREKESPSLRTKESPSPGPSSLIREPHKYFDQVLITVRSGDGGHGAILSMPNQRAPSKPQGKHDKDKMRKKSSYKRDFDGSLILPVGGHGGGVIIYADEGEDSLLEFHKKSRHNAKRGGNVDAMGVLTSQLHDGLAAPTLRIPVPVGTVVKRKRGKLLADLAQPGDEILVARGGQGGISLIEMPEHKRKKLMALTTNLMRDDNDKVLILGQPGEEVSLELILRVVADVGLVGLPNAGKSTLLAAITLAKPDIADYPFTTLMPNLGMFRAGKYSSEATLADLPGLIEGAHLGKGLGRNFLRHLRRTRLLVHVVDAAAEDPVKDYRTVKEAMDRLPSLTQEIMKIGSEQILSSSQNGTEDAIQSLPSDSEGANVLSLDFPDKERKDKEIEDYPRPLLLLVSVFSNKAKNGDCSKRFGRKSLFIEENIFSLLDMPSSLSFSLPIKFHSHYEQQKHWSVKGIRINEMLKEIRAALRKCQDANG